MMCLLIYSSAGSRTEGGNSFTDEEIQLSLGCLRYVITNSTGFVYSIPIRKVLVFWGLG